MPRREKISRRFLHKYEAIQFFTRNLQFSTTLDFLSNAYSLEILESLQDTFHTLCYVSILLSINIRCAKNWITGEEAKQSITRRAEHIGALSSSRLPPQLAPRFALIFFLSILFIRQTSNRSVLCSFSI